MAKPDSRTVASLLREYAHRSSLRGGNPYRTKAYLRAADSLAALSQPLDRIIAAGALTRIPGIGDAIADIVRQLYETGTHPRLEKLREEVPAGVMELFAVPGLRPDKILKLHQALGVNSLAELEAAARADRIRPVKGLGASFQAKILQNLAIARSGETQLHLHKAAALLEHAIISVKQAHPEFSRVEIAGDFRRGCELVADLALVAQGKKRTEIEQSTLRLVVTDKKHFGASFLEATGSAAHLEQLRMCAAERGFALKPDGLYRGRKLIASVTEEEIYDALGLQFIEPELREGRDEVERAARRQLPTLVRDEDLHGILHSHTTASDGTETLEAMAEATRERGFEYYGVADHSQSAHYAGGLTLQEIAEQHREADRLNKRYDGKFRILKGVEADILADGSLDYPDHVLEQFNFVVASVHSRFKLPKKEQTDRIIEAIANPFTTIIGHMTGRQLLRRPGYDLDIDKVLRTCARYGVAVEINAHPWRLDLDWRWHQKALDYGCIFSINPDAHSIRELDHMHWGVEMARKGGVPRTRVLNAMGLAALLAHLSKRKRDSKTGGNSRSPARKADA
ncbi:MAG: DNA polymerase/3'-5' exonuclease PolX [Mesorhizobium sp.]|uniref:DNA polymerase/3'-5' exonuclease PolX n=1 Tax=unclassified Mesorhizobium TaxID=325217 RepID=UPI000FCBFDD0|nr:MULTISPECIES: DNA polymerase/3'-5' exonuclease PolX [unclassified Mesorhizobium]RUV40301.1 DNA polymerase/3'-5' exonuclease PolX [Mesorhizobium sp. M1A.T.Ca.IN.004.03.1.1]RWG16312.1 MAG: DNA polymerase/3'-5' exonuclease PolX [Mesorhizobium sp.]RWI90066.1 MAG: DNA polymerase/3'-5' exonuclease PolX [Mesorhizobium sp.]RWK30212.1 MAG: DNA polymerase/3'-5' exonuclease PolX [Mesorhizobium sp.]RWK91886.1 MAG: DNA polymerase/3'-5' exonuclease PolX [Mesorhizobium sp.]